MPYVDFRPRSRFHRRIRKVLKILAFVLLISLVVVLFISRLRAADAAYQRTLSEGLRLEENEQYSAASDLYLSYISTGPTPSRRRAIDVRLGSDLGASRQYGQAINALKDAGRVPPGEDSTIIEGLARDYQSVGDKKDALIYLNKYADILSKSKTPGAASQLADVKDLIQGLSR